MNATHVLPAGMPGLSVKCAKEDSQPRVLRHGDGIALLTLGASDMPKPGFMFVVRFPRGAAEDERDAELPAGGSGSQRFSQPSFSQGAGAVPVADV